MSGLLGIGTANASFNLNSDLINKLKSEETARVNSPLEAKLNALKESQNIHTSFVNQLTALKDLMKTETNDYEANLIGKSIGIDVSNKDLISINSFTIDISSLAKKDVYQSEKINSGDAAFNQTINVKGVDVTGSTYEELKENLNKIEGVHASIDKVSDTEYRLIIKSDSGEDNALNITGSNFDKIQSASNLNLTIDGVEHSYSKSNFEYEGYTIKALEEGVTKVNIEENNDEQKQKTDALFNGINNLKKFIEDKMYSNFSGDKSMYERAYNSLKDVLFDSEGEFFNKGVTLDEKGDISGNIDKNTANTLFDKMLNILDGLTMPTSFFSTYKDNNKMEYEKYEKELKASNEKIDQKYKAMESQFIAYNATIQGFAANFASLKLIIDQQNSK